ncbi:MAG: ImmA/IrrE family metallo-endopeptidase [Mesorhizobium sp.]
MTTRINQDFSGDRAGLQKALKIKDSFVRGDVQVSLDNPRAKGRRLTAAEVYFNFGPQALDTVLDRGAFIIQNRNNSSSNTIKTRIEKLRVKKDIFADKLQISTHVLDSFLSGKEYFPIKKLELACAILGMEESRISSYKNEPSEPLVRLRYYDEKRGDVNVFDEKLVEKLSAQSWKIGKIDYLNSLISSIDAINIYNPIDDEYIDTAYSVPGALKPTVEKGRRIALRIREELKLRKVRKRAIRVTEALDRIGSLYYSDSMEDAFCGMTLISSWSGRRVVVTNTKGENARQSVQRFTLAHELAHAASDPEEKFVPVKVGAPAGRAGGSAQTQGSKDYPEMRANSFAANFLAPDDEMKAALAERINENPIDVISDEFGISRSAAKWRLVALRIVGADMSPGHEENLFSSQATDIGDFTPTLNDKLKIAINTAYDRNLIHADTVESLLRVGEKVDR